MTSLRRLGAVVAGGLIGSSIVWALLEFAPNTTIDDAINYMWVGFAVGIAAAIVLTRERQEGRGH